MASGDERPDLPLIGTGRAADVYDLGDGRVLRRYRDDRGGSVTREAMAMQHLRSAGAPVPQVFSAEGRDMVIERLAGPTMLQAIERAPWRARAFGRELLDVHRRIHVVPAGDVDLPRLGQGDAVLHLDLHPGNVMLTDAGPIVIDWSNVVIGPPQADVMNTWMLVATSSPDDVPLLLRPIVGRVRRALTSGFVDGIELEGEARGWVDRMCERRLQDPNTRPGEQVQVRAFAARHGSRSA
jgi:aminoglycoside phosphotransferase (APT) family kinase protein